MGFRKPITSAAAVDTGQPAGAGARLYQGSDGNGVYGVLEFRDGIAGDAPAQVTGRANLVPQPGGGGGYTVQGGGLAVKGGSYNGATAPELDLNVEGLPAGGYGPVARLLGAPAGLAPINSGSLTLPAGQFNTFPGIEGPGVDLLADGLVYVRGALQNSPTVALAAGSTVATLPTWARPKNTLIKVIWASGTASGFARLDVQPSGALVIQNAFGTSQGLSLAFSFNPNN